MMIILNADDLASFSVATRNEILARLAASTAGAAGRVESAPQVGPEYEGIDLEDVADLTFRQVQKWMDAASDKTKLGLRVFAERGPIIRAQWLIDAGIDNLPHFQSRTTIRTRTVTGDGNAFLLGWDSWEEVPYGQGRYAVTPITHQSLRRYFNLAGPY